MIYCTDLLEDGTNIDLPLLLCAASTSPRNLLGSILRLEDSSIAGEMSSAFSLEMGDAPIQQATNT